MCLAISAGYFDGERFFSYCRFVDFGRLTWGRLTPVARLSMIAPIGQGLEVICRSPFIQCQWPGTSVTSRRFGRRVAGNCLGSLGDFYQGLTERPHLIAGREE
jgi:hypothetical protein